ncbi:flavin reductase family protein [Corynebacterium sp.]|uniref:flavin reductase family protein n=1 Tax=Corynebacterium sp. TaxID=1720 RepID=UPI0028A5E71E|nr:flavin reductase family protein [Corynebacterium sp.]
MTLPTLPTQPTQPTHTAAATSPLTPTSLRSAWASIPTPITTVAAVVDGHPVGLIVGSYVGLSLEPALVAVSVQKSSRTWPLLRTAEHLGISVLTRAHQGHVRQLAGPVETRFDSVGWQTDRGAVLVDDAAVHLTGHVIDDIDTGDHITAVLQIDRVHEEAPSETPLVFHGSQVTVVGEL